MEVSTGLYAYCRRAGLRQANLGLEKNQFYSSVLLGHYKYTIVCLVTCFNNLEHGRCVGVVYWWEGRGEKVSWHPADPARVDIKTRVLTSLTVSSQP